MIKEIKEKNDNINIIDEKIARLKEIFPNCFDNNGNFDILNFENDIRSSCNVTKEGYGLNFLGKNYAKVIASLESETILVPDKDNNKNEVNKNSKNIYITGDNIDALKHLEKSYSNKIKCIYIDPPYNTGNDGFGYIDKFNFSVKKLVDILDISEEEAKRISDMTNSKSNSHSAWLTFMYPRLYIAKQLLKDDGVLMISIDDNEQAQLELLCKNMFGEENVETVIWKKIDPKYDRNTNAKIVKTTKRIHEYIILCFKNKEITTFSKVMKLPNWLNEYTNPDNDPRGNYKQGIISFQEGHKKEDKNSENYYSVVSPTGRKITRNFFFSKEEFEKFEADNRIYWPSNGDGIPALKIFENEEKEFAFETILDGFGSMNSAKKELACLFDVEEDKVPFSTPKPTKLIKELLRAVLTGEEDYVIDFFAGSSSTADAVLQLNAEDGGKRKYIMVQLPEDLEYNYKLSDSNGKKIIENQIALLKKINKPLYLDEIGEERIRKAAVKLKTESKNEIDYGFKHFFISELDNLTLDKLEKFEPNWIMQDKTIIDEFGIDSVLTTWMNADGYGLSESYEICKLDEYEAYRYKNTIYLINQNLSAKSIKCLIEKYENDESFDCNRIVLFGYSFDLNEIQTLKDNLKQVKNIKNINVDVITRY